MLFLIRASGLVAALAVAAPALAEQSPKHMSKISRPSADAGNAQAGFVKRCGAHFVCYTGIPLGCTPDTRPYQSIPDHQCYCLRDGCPQ
jgi:hypothetical protein